MKRNSFGPEEVGTASSHYADDVCINDNYLPFCIISYRPVTVKCVCCACGTENVLKKFAEKPKGLKPTGPQLLISLPLSPETNRVKERKISRMGNKVNTGDQEIYPLNLSEKQRVWFFDVFP